jgi:2-phospho-L-lactate guanylyltransferase
MAAICAVVPVKALARSKSRLVPELGPERARSLALAMLADTLAALRALPELARVAVLTPDPDAAEAARRAGAEVLLRPDPGLSQAVDAAARELTPGADDALLAVLGDLPAIKSSEIRELIRALPGRGVALAPARDGGTAALLRRPALAIEAGFGPDSARVHRERAQHNGLTLVELALPSLEIDVDRAEDLCELARRGSAGAHTRAWLGAPR